MNMNDVTENSNNSNNNTTISHKQWVSSNKSFKNQFYLKQTLDSFAACPINEIIILRISIPELNTISLFKVDRDSTVRELLYQILKKKRLSQNDGFSLYLLPNNKSGVEFGMWLDDSKPIFLYELYDQDILECKKKSATDLNQFHIKVVFPEQMKSKILQVDGKMLVKEAILLIKSKMDIVFDLNQDINNYGLYSLVLEHQTTIKIHNNSSNSFNNNFSSSNNNTTHNHQHSLILMKDNDLLSKYSMSNENMNIIEYRKKEIVILSLKLNSTNTTPRGTTTTEDGEDEDKSTITIQIKSNIHEIISQVGEWLKFYYKIEISNSHKLLLYSKSLKLWLIDSKPLDSYNIKKNDLLYIFPKIVDDVDLEKGICLKVNFSACNIALELNNGNSNKLTTKTLPGELLILKIDNTILLNVSTKPILCDIYMTNFQLIFFAKESKKEYIIHLGVISKIEKESTKKSNHSKFCSLNLNCKDFRFIRILFNKKEKILRKKLYSTLKQQCYPGIHNRLFSFYNKERFNTSNDEEDDEINGWNIYDSEKEYARLGIIQNSGWRISQVNRHYDKCSSYSKFLVVPETVTDDQLNDVFLFRSKGRIPALSWKHPINGSTITRCSQPLVGLTRSRCQDDELLLKQIAQPDKPMVYSGILNFTTSSNNSSGNNGSGNGSSILQNKRASYYSSNFDNLMNSGSGNSGNSNGNHEKAVLNLLDARPKVNAIGNKAMGAGFEDTNSLYTNCNIDFLNIANIHAVRESYEKLKSICIDSLCGIQEYIPIKTGSGISNGNNGSNSNSNEESDQSTISNSNSVDDFNSILQQLESSNTHNDVIDNNEGYDIKDNIKWFEGIESSKWFDHILTIMKGAIKIVDSIHRNSTSVLLHCSDGWDRTSQLSSIAMILLDPYYRTVTGFIVLIEKEWLEFGHKFSDRIGQGSDSKYDERSPIFLQFIECIFHILKQFKNYFQFNQNLLIEIMVAIYSNRFGTFLFNTSREREINNVKQFTVSLWSMILAPKNISNYTNSNYIKTDKILIPSVAIPYYCLWKNYYLKYLLLK